MQRTSASTGRVRTRAAVADPLILDTPLGRSPGSPTGVNADWSGWDRHYLSEDEALMLAKDAANSDVDPYEDLPRFHDRAVRSWARLTAETRARVAQVAAQTSARPELCLMNLPTQSNLGDTPTRVSSTRTTTGALSEFVMMVFSVGLGFPISYVDQRNGNVFHDVFPTEHSANLLSSRSSTAPLPFHSEMFFHPSPPQFLLLHCLRADQDTEAITSVAAFEHIDAVLSNDDRQTLREPRFAVDLARLHGSYTRAGRAIAETDPRPVVSVVTATGSGDLVRFEPELMTPLDDAAAAALHRAEEGARNVAASGVLAAGSLLLIDNRRAVHSRSSFKATFSGRDRWLRRMMVRSGPTPPDCRYLEDDTELTRGWLALGAGFTTLPYAPQHSAAGGNV